MIRYSILIVFLAIATTNYGQNASVEKSVFGIQTGLLGIWGHNESRLTNTIALRSEIGFDVGIRGGSFYEKTEFLATPVFTLSPRWYYNIKRRQEKSKRIDGNSANYVALKTSFRPDWFVISNASNSRYIDEILIVPTWGIRRNIGKHINYEVGLGLGYIYQFTRQAGYENNEGSAIINLDLKIGYRF